jgi:hypothetical protein
MTGGSIRPNRSASAEIVRGLTFAGLMLAVSGGAKILTSMGVLADTTWPQRLTMVLLGVFLMAMGNDFPKAMRPLASMTCDPARLQRFQRLAGWTWVTTGGLFAVAWLVLPVTIARPVTVFIIGIGIAIVGGSILRLRR